MQTNWGCIYAVTLLPVSLWMICNCSSKVCTPLLDPESIVSPYTCKICESTSLSALYDCIIRKTNVTCFNSWAHWVYVVRTVVQIAVCVKQNQCFGPCCQSRCCPVQSEWHRAEHQSAPRTLSSCVVPPLLPSSRSCRAHVTVFINYFQHRRSIYVSFW